MGFVRGCFGAGVLALVACGSDNATPDASIDAVPDAKVWDDAPPGPTYDLSCSGNSAPTTATAQITLSGVVTNAGVADNPVEGATVKACKAGAPDCTGSNQLG